MIASNLNFQRDWAKIPFFEIYPFDFIFLRSYHSIENTYFNSEYRFFINCNSDFNSEISKASFEKNGTIGKSYYFDSGIAFNRLFSIVHDFHSGVKISLLHLLQSYL